MRDLTLFRTMLGIPSSANVLKHLEGPQADSPSCFFIESGYLMEFIEVNFKKIVFLFFGPEDFAIQCHPDSNLQCLGEVHVKEFSHEAVVRLLKEFPETREAYRGIRKEYYEKVTERLRLQQMPAEKRFEHLQKKQPWVFDLADRKNIACYLGISVSILEKLTR